MINRIDTFNKNIIPKHEKSLEAQDDYVFKLYECVVHPTQNGPVCLIVGYDDDCYVMIVSREGLPVNINNINIRTLDKRIVEEFYTLTPRPTNGILRQPMLGDCVLCVARDRYMGVDSGDEYSVVNYDGRVFVAAGSKYSYSNYYFLVTSTSNPHQSKPWNNKFRTMGNASTVHMTKQKNIIIGSLEGNTTRQGSILSRMLPAQPEERFYIKKDGRGVYPKKVLDTGKLLVRGRVEERIIPRKIYKIETLIRKSI